jgi:YHS domain-containing protein
MPSWAYLLLWGAVFLLFMRFGCGGHVMGHGHGRHSGRHGDDSTGAAGTRGQSPEKAVDPVCNMSVETKTAKTAAYEGTVYYFCSQSCRDKFEASPQTYAKPSTDTPRNAEHHHG